MTGLRLFLAGAAIALIAFGAGWWFATDRLERRLSQVVAWQESGTAFDLNTPASSVDIPRLERLALAACRCDDDPDLPRRNKECWQEYDNALSAFASISSSATACAPISTSIDCIGTDEGEECVVSGYGIKGICTDEEARAVEHAWATAYAKAEAGEGQADADHAANAAMANMVNRIRRGEAFARVSTPEGCI